MEHLIAVEFERYGFVNGHTGVRYVRFVIDTRATNLSKIAKELVNRPLSKEMVQNELDTIREEYQYDLDNKNLDLKYRALFGLNAHQMVAWQKKILDRFTISARQVALAISILQPLDNKDDLEKFQYHSNLQVPKRYLDPPLRLSNKIIFSDGYFAFMKKCVNQADAKVTLHRLYNLQDTGKISDVHYFGITKGYLLATGIGKPTVASLLKILQKEQIGTLLPPLGRPARRQLMREAVAKEAFGTK